jgi:hypothetical protein
VKAEVMVKEEVKVKIKDKVEKTSGFPFSPAYRRQRPRSYLAPDGPRSGQGDF